MKRVCTTCFPLVFHVAQSLIFHVYSTWLCLLGCSIGQWARDWDMHFNEKKCYIISTLKDSHPYFYQLNGYVLKGVPLSPYLGVLLSENCCLKRNGLFLTRWFQPGICISCVGPFLQSDINILQRIQRRAARFVQGRGRWSPINTSPHHTVLELSWDSLNHRRKLARLSLLYKTLNGAVALPTDKLIKQHSRTRGRKKTILSISGVTKTSISHTFFRGQ